MQARTILLVKPQKACLIFFNIFSPHWVKFSCNGIKNKTAVNAHPIFTLSVLLLHPCQISQTSTLIQLD